ncbi:NAD(P)H-dependent oxidoreductase [Flavobacterium sp.]|uniref:NAD(P)H-dependent oxidoreductase n=1 Tax=Flavobacterium sp. TaxID=239 RepID=UPI00262E0733|nr:NAD(P)H-dependent oxidoreductase [Flavobacterium sp.]
MNSFIENAQWRYATKKYDPTRKISAADLAVLKEAISLSASSYGLQPYKVIFVENPELRAQLQPASWGQSQIVEASHLVVFANELNLGDAQIDAYFENLIQTRGISMENVQGYADFMKASIQKIPLEVRNVWTAKQTYIALSNLMNAAAELKIDTTPMEGFEPKLYNEILGLNERNLNAALVCAIGYRHPDDTTQHYAKVRKSESNLFESL